MYPQFHISPSSYIHTIPMIDKEFDDVELNQYLAADKREAEEAVFYHDTFSSDE